MGQTRVTQADLERAKRETAAGKTEYNTGKKRIETLHAEVNSGKIGGSVSVYLVAVFDTIRPTLEKANRYFDEADQLMLRANKEYVATTEEAMAEMNKARM